jgi:hypothetical protein
MRILRLTLRHRPLALAAALTTLTITLHLAFRGHGWAYEWLWAINQYGFTTVFLGPLACGVAAWEGAVWSSAHLPTASPARNTRVVAAELGALLTATLAPYVLGLGVVCAIVAAHGPAAPSARVLSAIAPPMLLLVGYIAGGFAFGWVVRSRPLAAAVGAVASFACTLVAFAALPGHVVDVGSVTGSLLGLTMSGRVVAAQVGFWLCIAVAAVGAVALAPWRRAGLASIPLVLAILVVVLGPPASADRLVADPAPRLVCAGSPRICLDPAYERFRTKVVAAFAPDLLILRQAGAPLPALLTQAGPDAPAPAVTAGIDTEVVRGNQQAAGLELVDGYLPASCDLSAHPSAWRTFDALQDVLVGPNPTGFLVADSGRTHAPPAVTRAIVANLQHCR